MPSTISHVRTLMPAPELENSFRIVSPVGSGPLMRFDRAALARLEGYVRQGVSALSGRGMEIGGLVIGSAIQWNESEILITDFLPVDIEYRFGPTFRISDTDLTAFELAAGNTEGQVIGCFRSQIRDDAIPRPEDLRLLSRLFPASDACFLAIHATSNTPSNVDIHQIRNGAAPILWELFALKQSEPAARRFTSPAVVAAPTRAPEPVPLATHEFAPPAEPNIPAAADVVPVPIKSPEPPVPAVARAIPAVIKTTEPVTAPASPAPVLLSRVAPEPTKITSVEPPIPAVARAEPPAAPAVVKLAPEPAKQPAPAVSVPMPAVAPETVNELRLPAVAKAEPPAPPITKLAPEPAKTSTPAAPVLLSGVAPEPTKIPSVEPPIPAVSKAEPPAPPITKLAPEPANAPAPAAPVTVLKVAPRTIGEPPVPVVSRAELPIAPAAKQLAPEPVKPPAPAVSAPMSGIAAETVNKPLGPAVAKVAPAVIKTPELPTPPTAKPAPEPVKVPAPVVAKAAPTVIKTPEPSVSPFAKLAPEPIKPAAPPPSTPAPSAPVSRVAPEPTKKPSVEPPVPAAAKAAPASAKTSEPPVPPSAKLAPEPIKPPAPALAAAAQAAPEPVKTLVQQPRVPTSGILSLTSAPAAAAEPETPSGGAEKWLLRIAGVVVVGLGLTTAWYVVERRPSAATSDEAAESTPPAIPPAASPASYPLNVSVTGRAGKMEIRWNPSGPAIGAAAHGILLITARPASGAGSGPQPRPIDLNASQLRAGIYLYEPLTDATVSVTIFQEDGKTSSGVTEIRGTVAQPAPSTAAAGIPGPVRLLRPAPYEATSTAPKTGDGAAVVPGPAVASPSPSASAPTNPEPSAAPPGQTPVPAPNAAGPGSEIQVPPATSTQLTPRAPQSAPSGPEFNNRPGLPAPARFVSPKMLHQVFPVVPPVIASWIRSDVLLNVSVTVDPSGQVSEAHILSSGLAKSDKEAQMVANETLKAARMCSFVPAQQDGRPVTGTAVLSFRFGPKKR